MLLCYVYCAMICEHRFLHCVSCRISCCVLRLSLRYVLRKVLCVVLHILRHVLYRVCLPFLFFAKLLCHAFAPQLAYIFSPCAASVILSLVLRLNVDLYRSFQRKKDYLWCIFPILNKSIHVGHSIFFSFPIYSMS